MYLHTKGRLVLSRQTTHRQAIVKEKAHEADHPTLAVSYSNLALVEKALGNLNEARRLLEQAYEIAKSKLGPEHATTKTIHRLAASLAWGQAALRRRQFPWVISRCVNGEIRTAIRRLSPDAFPRTLAVPGRLPSRIKTFTFDNGTEFFYDSMLTEALKVKVYFADPYDNGRRGEVAPGSARTESSTKAKT